MIRQAWSGVRFARGRAAALGAGVMVAAVAFSLLTAAVDVGVAQIKGEVGANWRGAYDLLILPKGSEPAAKGSPSLIQGNYLATATGGITVAQDDTIARLPGVGIAAPLAVVGYVLETVGIPVDVSALAGGSGAAVMTITSHFTADHGLSSYPAHDDGYIYVTPNKLGGLQLSTDIAGTVELLPNGKQDIVCPFGSSLGSLIKSPFQRDAGLNGGSCYSRQDPTSSPLNGYVSWSFPVLIAGIDPAAENALTGMGRTVNSGRYLTEGEVATQTAQGAEVPVIASTASFDGDVDDVTVNLLPPAAVNIARSGSPSGIVTGLEGQPSVQSVHATITGTQAWDGLLADLAKTATVVAGTGSTTTQLSQIVGQYWTVGPVSYNDAQGGALAPVPVDNPVSVWQSGVIVNGSSFVHPPPAAQDTGFRSLTESVQTSGAKAPMLQEVGAFDPTQLSGFTNGAVSPLATYRAPLLTGADAASQHVLGGQPLEPDGNMAGYAQQPPLLLTTIPGVQALENPAIFFSTDGRAAAPIGSIRVRVTGLLGSVQQQLAKIAAVGQEIGKATGLRVVVTAGSSPEQVTIALPAGAFGRPPLRLSESWTATAVVLVVLRQADRESLALFGLILLVCVLFLVGASLAGVRSRRGEIGILRALGWGRLSVFAVTLGEVVALGVIAGAVGAVVSFALVAGLKLEVPWWRAALVLPVAALLALASGLIPAWLAARTEPANALAPSVRAPRRRGLPVRSIAAMAVTGVARVPGRCVLSGAALAAGVAGLTVLLAAQASFSQSIGDSALAGLVTASTRGTDLVSALLAVGLGAAAVTDITFINQRERAGELAALAASGWGRLHLIRLLATEALITALLGALLGGALGLAASAAAFGVSFPVIAAALGAAVGGTALALASTTAMLMLSSGRPLAAVLAADE